MKDIRQRMTLEERKHAAINTCFYLALMFFALATFLVVLSIDAWSANKVITVADYFIAIFLDFTLCAMLWYWCALGVMKIYKVKIRRNHK